MQLSLAGTALLLAVATSVSCREPTLPEWELRAAQGRWARAGSDSYRITVTRFCFFCPPDMAGPVTVDVVDGVVQSLRYAETGDLLPQSHAAGWPTIDGLFAIVESLRRDPDVRFSVVFDPTCGYPASIQSHRPGALDSGLTLVAHDLVLR